jgi:hypothetical protein
LIRHPYPWSFIGQCYREKTARTNSAARFAFNGSVKNDVNMQIFEAARCGSLLQTNDKAQLPPEETPAGASSPFVATVS